MHESAVHVLLSSQAALSVQQPVMAVCRQVRFATSQRSRVHTSVSLQSAIVWQQLATRVFVQTPGVPADVSQASVVHELPSLHCALVVHEVAA